MHRFMRSVLMARSLVWFMAFLWRRWGRLFYAREGTEAVGVVGSRGAEVVVGEDVPDTVVVGRREGGGVGGRVRVVGGLRSRVVVIGLLVVVVEGGVIRVLGREDIR